MAGYSGTPLVKKLGYKPGMRAHVVSAPKHYRELLGDVPADVEFLARAAADLDLVHLFVRSRADLSKAFPPLAPLLKPAGMLWVSWPKKTSKLVGDLGENEVRAIGLAAGLVDVKVCAVDEDWSGLKFVRRVKDR
jgi:hypothetical protein